MSQKQNKTTSSEDNSGAYHDGYRDGYATAKFEIRKRDKLIEARARLNLIDEFGEKQSQSSISRGDMLAYLQVMQKQAEAEIKRLEES